MTGDLKEKYYRINLDFPVLAGRMDMLHTAQKRLVERMARTKGMTDDQKALLVSVAESIEAGEDLLRYTQKFLHGVCDDAQALTEGAGIRNIAKWQNDL
jgi:hypothetical protein